MRLILDLSETFDASSSGTRFREWHQVVIQLARALNSSKNFSVRFWNASDDKDRFHSFLQATGLHQLGIQHFFGRQSTGAASDDYPNPDFVLTTGLKGFARWSASSFPLAMYLPPKQEQDPGGHADVLKALLGERLSALGDGLTLFFAPDTRTRDLYEPTLKEIGLENVDVLTPGPLVEVLNPLEYLRATETLNTRTPQKFFIMVEEQMTSACWPYLLKWLQEFQEESYGPVGVIILNPSEAAVATVRALDPNVAPLFEMIWLKDVFPRRELFLRALGLIHIDIQQSESPVLQDALAMGCPIVTDEATVSRHGLATWQFRNIQIDPSSVGHALRSLVLQEAVVTDFERRVSAGSWSTWKPFLTYLNKSVSTLVNENPFNAELDRCLPLIDHDASEHARSMVWTDSWRYVPGRVTIIPDDMEEFQGVSERFGLFQIIEKGVKTLMIRERFAQELAVSGAPNGRVDHSVTLPQSAAPVTGQADFEIHSANVNGPLDREWLLESIVVPNFNGAFHVDRGKGNGSGLTSMNHQGPSDRLLESGEFMKPREHLIALAYFEEFLPDLLLMVDVGAHWGTTMKPFVEAGWNVLGIEPNSGTFSVLNLKYAGHKKIKMYNVALGEEYLPIASAHQSDSARETPAVTQFHDSASHSGSVEVQSLEDMLRRAEGLRLSFLKIDTGGFELQILRSLSLTTERPEIILVKFGARERGHHYTANDLAEHLLGAGYSLYVSEWRPYTKHGQKNTWALLTRYQDWSPSGTASGQIIAFAHDPGWGWVESRFLSQCLGGTNRDRTNLIAGGAVARAVNRGHSWMGRCWSILLRFFQP